MKTITMRNTLLFTVVLTLFTCSSAFAAGIGITKGSGNETWTSGSTEDDNPYSLHHDGDRKIDNFGVFIDTTVAKDTLFNYRFSLVSEENNADSAGYNIDMKGISMIHDFGFGVVRSRMVRLWLGPELKAAFYGDITASSPSSIQFDGNGDVWGFGLGPVVGLNVHLPKVVSFSFTAAYYLVSQYFGQYDITYFGSSDSVDVDDSSKGLFINASIIFRFHDNY